MGPKGVPICGHTTADHHDCLPVSGNGGGASVSPHSPGASSSAWRMPGRREARRARGRSPRWTRLRAARQPCRMATSAWCASVPLARGHHATTI